MTSDARGASLYARRIESVDGAASDAQRSWSAENPCPACDGRRGRAIFRVEGVDSAIVRCEGCGLARFEPMLEASLIADFYPSAYYAEQGESGAKFHPLVESLVRRVGQRHARFLARGLEPGARILDVGCGRGVLLRPLADLGFEMHGVEANVAALSGSEARAEVRIALELADAGYPAGHFDQIIIWHVLEHLRDPAATLRECARIAKPGARLVVAVPNFSSWQARWSGGAWFHLDPPRHLYHFSLESLEQIVARHGFEIESVHHFSLRQNPFGWIQSALNRYSADAPNRLYDFLQRRRSVRELGVVERASMWLLLFALAPLAVALSVCAALARSGATVHVVARKSAPKGGA